ncbi:MAG: hypothetical protein EBQ99_07195 [Planctomycetes bacterium]|nr:hypothetical protein [Planctomycetota bacterium]
MNAAAVPALVQELRRTAVRGVDRTTRTTLQRLEHRLDRATADRLPAVAAEVLVALRVIRAGCSVEAETPTPTGRTCDFRLERQGQRLFVHVKRLQLEPFDPPSIPAPLRSRLRVARGVRAVLRWDARLDRGSLQRLGGAVAGFLRQGAIGESLVVKGPGERELGGVRLDRPTDRLELRVERPDRTAALERLDRLLDRAAQQAMPGQPNAIVVVGSCAADADLLDQCLLGSFVARWDRLPRRGERQAFGRDDTGLWSGRAARDLTLACWVEMQEARAVPRLSAGQLWLRGEPAPSPASAALARASLLRSRAG